MADLTDSKAPAAKSPHALREEKILASWKEKGIFEKTLAKESPKGEFVFYEGPPTANGRPGIHHLEARSFKDAVPRYRTMRGYHVARKGGWDTHGLPVEIQVQKELGLTSKKDIEAYGLEAFNKKCKESVWKYVHEWEDFTNRMGYWVDLKHPYITYEANYMESVWNILKTADDKKLLYKDYRVVPWCPHDETVLSSHELAQGYQDVKDLTLIAKFEIRNTKSEINTKSETGAKTYLLAWTTTPWTLPGNAALAVGPKLDYVQIKRGEESLILAKSRLSVVKEEYTIEKEFKGSDLVGLSYEPLYPYLRDAILADTKSSEKEKLAAAFKVYAADFVTTTDGTGIVHIAPMYGQDDFELGTKVGLPKYHIVNENGTFKKGTGSLAERFVKDEAVAIDIIKDLANRPSGSLLFHKEKHEHSYPHCWRCKTPLIYFARDSWYIRMSDLRDKLVSENESIHWEPGYIKEGRFGEWLREVKDWAISRERYWGTPLPVWVCEKCKQKKVAGSAADVSKKPRNSYHVMRHGEADNNIQNVLASDPVAPIHLTPAGKGQVAAMAAAVCKEKFDLIIASPFVRTQETLAILNAEACWAETNVISDPRIHELDSGTWLGKPISELGGAFPVAERFSRMPEGAETYADVKKRMGDFLYDIDSRYEGKKILVITHGTPAMMLMAAAQGLNREQTLKIEVEKYISNAELRPLEFRIIPHNAEYELDLHRPYIDEVALACSCGGEMKRVKEVMDVWLDSGAMPFAQAHYPFKNDQVSMINDQGWLAKIFSKKEKKEKLAYPADFISEAIDQTRGWFYTLHAVGAIMGTGKAYKNVISLGHILDGEGKKMSKSVGNVIDPWGMMDKYGADALRFWMYSVNQPGEPKNFEEKTVDEIVKKVFNLAANVATFYRTYAGEKSEAQGMKSEARNTKSETSAKTSQNILDRWILARLDQLVGTVTENMDAYVFLEPTRAIRDFVADLSQWYLRRSRDRFKGEGSVEALVDKEAAVATTKHVLLTLAKVMAPFTPFFAEELYQDVGGEKESVHLEEWPVAGKADADVLAGMQLIQSFATIAHMQRSQSKIPVRQPLQKFTIKHKGEPIKYWDELKLVLADEVNVKEVTLVEAGQDEASYVLDTDITPALKEEGTVRELVRAIQDMRKEAGLTVSDKAVLSVDTDEKGSAFIEKNKAAIMSATLLKEVKLTSLESAPVIAGEYSFKLGVGK